MYYGAMLIDHALPRCMMPVAVRISVYIRTMHDGQDDCVDGGSK